MRSHMQSINRMHEDNQVNMTITSDQRLSVEVSSSRNVVVNVKKRC